MKIISSLIFFGLVGYGIWWVNDKHPEWKEKAYELIQSGEFATLEVRYTPEQIMEENKRHLLKSSKHKYLSPVLKFYPYLLLEVKYSISTEKTGESIILWDLIDGEMVTETKNWEKTHGFGDCINAKANKSEFQILNALAKRGGALERDALMNLLSSENPSLSAWIESCRRKKLIVLNGQNYRLHMQNPKLAISPQTEIYDRIVTKSFTNAPKITPRYSPREIKRVASFAFGEDFAIRTTRSVFLPVYSIVVQNPDGSLHSSYWNALNGKQILDRSFME